MEAPDKGPLQGHIEGQLFDMVKGSLPFSSGINFTMACAFAFLISPSFPWTTLALWLFWVGLVLALRYAFHRYSTHRYGSDYRVWFRGYRFLTLCLAVAWGSNAWWAYNPQSQQDQLVLILVQVGIGAGALGLLAPVQKVYSAYLVMVMAPLSFRLAWEGGRLNLTLALMALAFILVLSLGAKGVEASLWKSFFLRQQLQDLTYTQVDWIWEVDQEGHYTKAEGEVERIIGYQEAELLGKSPLFHTPEENKPQILAKLRALLDARQPFRDFSYWVQTKQGGKRFLVTNGVPFFSREGEFLGFRVVARDETEEKVLSDHLLQKEAKLDAVMKATQVGMFECGGQSILWMNQGMEAITGKNTRELQGSDPLSLFHPDDRLRLQEAMEEAQASATSALELRVLRADHQIIWVSFFCSPLDQGDQQRQLATLVDISNNKAMLKALEAAKEEALAGSRAKSLFLANMSHEIRTPLSGVIGSANLLKHSNLEGRQRDWLETILSSGEILLSVINDILDFSKIETGKLELEKNQVQLFSAIEEVVQLTYPLINPRHLDLEWLVEGSRPPAFWGDGMRFKQILVNLVNNAIKFTKDGHVWIKAKTRLLDPERMEIKVTVEDTGIGIAPDRLETLFQDFTQADAATRRRFGGTGLGLAISRRLIELMGGQISVASQLGQGTCFTLSLPVTLVPPAQKPATPGPLLGKRLWMINADDLSSQRLSQLYESWGMEVLSCKKPEQCRRLPSRVDLVLLDARFLKLAPGLVEDLAPLVEAQEVPVLAMGSGLSALPFLKVERPVRAHRLKQLTLSALDLAPLPEEGSQAKELGRTALYLPAKILVAEDNLINQKMSLATFELLGYQADLAEDGQRAVTMAGQKAYDLVFMDLQMPELDGYQATRQILEQVSPAPTIIALTANATKDEEGRCLQAGMQDFLPKPLRIEDLRKMLQKWLGRKRGLTPPLKAALSPPRQWLDLERLQQLQSLYPAELFQEMLAHFEQDLAEKSAEIHQWIGQSKFDKIYLTAHNLKGASKTLGASRLASLLQAIEETSLAGDLQTLTSLMREMETTGRETCRELSLSRTS